VIHSNQGRTGHRGNAMLVAGAFTISYTICLERGLLKEFWGLFGFFLYGMSQRSFDPSTLLIKTQINITSTAGENIFFAVIKKRDLKYFHEMRALEFL
jgi:hypothetical protein